MWAVTEESLLAGLGSGDPAAATAFVERFQGKVYGLALAVLADPQAAEEVSQETFIRAWRCADTYDPRRGRVTPWLLSIARNLAIDALRLRRCEPTDPEELQSLDRSASESGPDERSIIRDECRRIGRAVAELPTEQRRALLLGAMYGCTAREISEMEEVPLGTAKKRIRMALMKLRSVLEVVDDR